MIFAGIEFNAFAGYIYAENADAKSGRCAPPPDGSPEEVLKRNGISTSGRVKDGEKYALAKAISQVERLRGSPIPRSWQTTFNFIEARGAWNQAASQINVRRLSYGGDNVGALMHEFGHKVANADGQKIFSQYTQSAKRCGITPYAQSSRGEEFGEVFSAYIVNPQDLKLKCPSSYKFFSEQLFIGSAEADCSNPTKVVVSGTTLQSTGGHVENSPSSGGFLTVDEPESMR